MFRLQLYGAVIVQIGVEITIMSLDYYFDLRL